MFRFVVKRLSFLKKVPLLPHLFDAWMRIWIYFTNRDLAKTIDDIELEISSWKGVSLSLHKYGGTQFNVGAKEIGHIHSNGLLDILFNKSLKTELLKEGRVSDHHVFKNSGWISFYVKTKEDKEYAVGLLREAYENCSTNAVQNLEYRG